METWPDQEEDLEPRQPTPRCYWALGLMGLSVLSIQSLVLWAILADRGVSGTPPPEGLLVTLLAFIVLAIYMSAGLSFGLAVGALLPGEFVTRDRVERGLMWFTIVVDVPVLFAFVCLFFGALIA